MIEVRRFLPEQQAGLRELGFDFTIEAKALSIAQLCEDPDKGLLLDSLIGEGIDMIPVPREVAVNPHHLALPNSELLFDQQVIVAEHEAAKLRDRKLRRGTLDGIDFGIDHASVYAQFDLSFKGKTLLFPNFFAQTKDMYDNQNEHSAIGVGRFHPFSRLRIGLWDRFTSGFIYVVLVATPAGPR